MVVDLNKNKSKEYKELLGRITETNDKLDALDLIETIRKHMQYEGLLQNYFNTVSDVKGPFVMHALIELLGKENCLVGINMTSSLRNKDHAILYKDVYILFGSNAVLLLRLKDEYPFGAKNIARLHTYTLTGRSYWGNNCLFLKQDDTKGTVFDASIMDGSYDSVPKLNIRTMVNYSDISGKPLMDTIGITNLEELIDKIAKAYHVDKYSYNGRQRSKKRQ